MIFLDTETCGLCGPAVIIQYATLDSEIKIHNFWTETFQSSLDLIKLICQDTVVGFNLTFDWFQIQKIYNMFELFIQQGGDPYSMPSDYIEALAELEPDARLGNCVKPKGAIDLMLVARKTKYQSTMNRGDIRIKRVPTILADKLAAHLEKEIVLSGILFARRKDKYAPKWKVYDCQKDGVYDPDFKDIVLKFKPSVALKALAIDALNIPVEDVLLFKDIDIDKAWLPNELPYAPFALAVKNYKVTGRNYGTKAANKIDSKSNYPWKWAWPDVIHKHIEHWTYYEPARKYAALDVDYTRQLYEFFGCPEVSDDDVLACMVGSVRWRGYTVNIDGLKKLRLEAIAKIKATPMAPKAVKAYLFEMLSPTEQAVIERDGTGKLILEDLAKKVNIDCPVCAMMGDGYIDPTCDVCQGTNKYTHPAAERARIVLEARFARKKMGDYDKLILAGRFHASFKVIGTLSNRMSGADGFNAQGVDRGKSVRVNFTFKNADDTLSGGDFDGFEVVIAEAAYNDPKLREALLKKAICPGCKGSGKSKGLQCKDCKGEGQTGQKIHGLFAMELFPGVTYEEVVQSKGTKFDMYDYGKRGVFSQVYGGDENTLVKKLGLSMEVALRASKTFLARYPKMAQERMKIFNRFCSMRQEKGIGSKVVWNKPDEYIESLLGFKRWFTLENMVCESLFKLANSVPSEWKKLAGKVKVQRRDREQTATGAICSALYSAAFQLQAANMRAAANHVIQSTGAQITKGVQRKVWDIQPHGVHKWLVQPCNIHDEILSVNDPSVDKKVETVVNESVESYRGRIPLIKMEWHSLQSWADK